ncbi:MAG: Asp-tRNA(Asn)/Glu-tRNA(Gln) amidotransferase subunit GatC [Candidatus Thioglobus sp.]|nr:Asp-tRNA(Asn)/Glu-tRNA(Gln) amidotransferase subunit GatC [Candidatus Thioglobus sp.]
MIDEPELKQIAYLAKLLIADGQSEKTAADLNNILQLAEKLATADTSKISPMAHPLQMTQRLRADEVSEKDQSELFQSIAPKTEKRHYLVPTVIE